MSEKRPRKLIERATLLRAVALLAITLIAYIPAMRAGFIWDDPESVINNYNLRDAQGLGRIWFDPRSLPQYYPLVHTTFWVEYQMWGLKPVGYHVTNVLLHAAGAVLLWRVLVKLDVPGAWLAAAIFAVHPVHVESVAWISERKNVLSGVFYFAAGLTYLKFLDDERRNWKQYALAIGLFVCGLLSKTVTCSLPAALLLVIWWKRGRVKWDQLLPLAPMFLIGLGAAFYTAHLEVHHVGAKGAEWDYSPIERLIIAGQALWFYVAKLAAPVDLAFVYPKWTVQTWGIAYYVTAVGVILTLILLHRRIGRGPATAALFFSGTVLPALGFFKIYPMRYTFVADHYQYLASVGLIVLAAAGVVKSCGGRRAGWVGVVILIPLVAFTFMRARVFHEPVTLWTDTVRKNPNSWMVNLNLGQAVGRAGKMDEAEKYLRRAVVLAPYLPETHWNLGVHLASQGKWDEAMRKYDDALSRDSSYAGAHFGRGNVYFARDQLDEAKLEYRRAIEQYPEYPQAHFQLALIAERQGDAQAAKNEYANAIKGNPHYAEAHNYLGRLLAKERKLDEAMAHYQAAVRSRPDFAEARLNLAAVLARLGRLEEARQQISEAVRLDPSLSKYADKALGQ